MPRIATFQLHSMHTYPTDLQSQLHADFNFHRQVLSLRECFRNVTRTRVMRVLSGFGRIVVRDGWVFPRLDWRSWQVWYVLRKCVWTSIVSTADTEFIWVCMFTRRETIVEIRESKYGQRKRKRCINIIPVGSSESTYSFLDVCTTPNRYRD